MNEFETVSITSDDQFGTQIGLRFKEHIQRQTALHQLQHPDIFLVSDAIEPYLTSSCQYVGDLVAQLSDMAEASGVPLDRLFYSFVPELEESTGWIHGPAKPERGTTIASFNNAGCYTIGHNEDWEDGDPSESLALSILLAILVYGIKVKD